MNESVWMVPVGARKHVQTRRITHPRYLILSQDAAFSHLSLYKTASAPAAYRGLQMENNNAKYGFFFLFPVFIAAACLCHPHLPNLPVNGEPAGSCQQNECVFSRSLWASVFLSSSSPSFILDVRIQHAADLMPFFPSIWAVVLSRDTNSVLQIHGRVRLQTAFLKLLLFWSLTFVGK